MSIFTKNRKSKERKIEEWVYEQVADELDRNEIRKGLWTKAIALSDGNDSVCDSIYIRLRAESITDTAKLIAEEADIQQRKMKHTEDREYSTNVNNTIKFSVGDKVIRIGYLDWGIGTVVNINNNMLQIDFEHSSLTAVHIDSLEFA